jgi:hypothetical protein
MQRGFMVVIKWSYRQSDTKLVLKRVSSRIAPNTELCKWSDKNEHPVCATSNL